MSEDALRFVSTSVGSRESQASPGVGSVETLHHSQEAPTYPMHTSGGKGEGSDLTPFHHNQPPAAYAPPTAASSSPKKGMNEASAPASSMDPSLTGARRNEGAQTGYPNMRQDQHSYRLDLLQTDPNLESNASLHGDAHEHENVARAFPFLSNSMAPQDGDGRASIFPPNFSSVDAATQEAAAEGGNLGYKKAEAHPQEAGASNLHAKDSREASYDTLSPPEKKETPYSRSPSLRVTHKIAERKRRKEMKDLFDEIKEYVPVDRGPKTSKGDILTKAVLQFQTLHREREQLIEALEAAHHELNQLRQVTGNADHAANTAAALPHHVYPPSSAAAPYLSRAQPPRLSGSLVHGNQEQHLSLARADKGDLSAHAAAGAAAVSIPPSAPRTGEPFLSDLRLDRLRQTDDAVHPNFKQLEHSTGVFQPESYQATSLVSSELAGGHDPAAMSAAEASNMHAGRAVTRDPSFSAQRYMPRPDAGDLMQDSAHAEPPNM